MLIQLAQPAPAPLPDVLVRDIVKALHDAATDGRPLSSAWGAAIAELDRMVRKRPEGDFERTFVQGLKAATAGKAGERSWALAAQSLRQTLAMQGSGTPEAIRISERLADLQAAQGLPDFPWRDRALAGRMDRSRGVDEALEGAVLASLKDHWGGFLEPPRREQTLARCGDLTTLWLRRPVRDRARALGRSAFEDHAGPLWAFAAREGDENLRDHLHDCLVDLPPQQFIANLDEKNFLAWVTALRESALAEDVRAIVLALDPLVEGRWGFESRAALLREAGLTSLYVDLLTEGLDRLPRDQRRGLLRKELLDLPKLNPAMNKRVPELLMEDPVLMADPVLRDAWAMKLQGLGMEAEASGLKGSDESAPMKEKGGKGGKNPDSSKEKSRERGLLGADAEAILLQAFESGRMDDAEALLWPVLEALARGEVTGPFKEDELSMLPSVLVEPWLRRRAPEEAILRLERMESLLLRAGSPLPVEFTKGLPGLRRKVERQRQLLLLLGSAAEP